MDVNELTESQAVNEFEKLFGATETAETPEPEADQPEDIQEEDEQEVTQDTDAEDTEIEAEEESEAEDAEDIEDDKPEPKLVIKHNGEEKEVTQSEAIALAQKGYDYEYKTKQLAETRQKAEELLTKAEQTAKTYVEQLDVTQAFLQYQMPTEEQLQAIRAQHGDVAYLTAKDQAEKVQRGIEAISANRQKVLDEQQAQYTAKRQELEAQEREALRNAAPELVTSEGSTKLVTYLSGLGYSQEQIQGEIDHRLFVIANKARKYDELMATRSKPVANVPKVTKQTKGRPDPKIEQSDRKRATIQQARKTGKESDAAAAFLAMGIV